MKLTNRELGTVLAALRLWQRSPWPQSDPESISTDGGKLVALLDDEIDELCERINETDDDSHAEPELLDLARNLHCVDSDNDIEIDDVAATSVGEDGIWVQAWVHVSNEVLWGAGLQNPEAVNPGDADCEHGNFHQHAGLVTCGNCGKEM